MSTRGCIARPVNDIGWEGRYNHFDSYPSGLGQSLWHAYHERFGGDAEALARFAIEEHDGWSSFPDGCYCHDRKEGLTGNDPEIRQIAGQPDEGDPLFIEWVYVISKAGLDIHKSYNTGGTEQLNNGTYDYDKPVYGWTYGATVLWTDPEPDWDALADTVYTIREEREATLRAA